MNGQSSLWLVHSIQFFDWKGVHRRNMPPTVVPGAPEPVKLQPPPRQDPVKSGLPLGSRGVGAAAGSPAGAPPPRPPWPTPPCAGPWAAIGAARRLRVINRIDAFIAFLTFQPSSRSPARA